MKRFSQFIKEDVSNQEFTAFVEEVLTSNKIDARKANDFLTNEYNYKGVLYKVLFCPLAEIQNFSQGGIPDVKAIADFIVKKFNMSRYVFFNKSLKSVENSIKYPGLFTISEDQVGVIYSNKTAGSIDLSLYESKGGKNLEVLARIESTEPVLSFEDLTINKIDGLYIFQDGWKFRTRLDQPIFSTNDTGVEPEEVAPEEDITAKADETPDEDQKITKGKTNAKSPEVK